MKFPHLTQSFRRQRLEPPQKPIRMVLDTDTYNEIDDQFAVVYALLSPERLKVEAVYAAPFHNERSSGPGDGMEKSYAEILRLFERLGRQATNLVYRGSTDYLSQRQKPEISPAVQDLMERALAAPLEDPLYVVAIGAITNIASAILIEPSIIEKIVVIWLGGQPHHLHFASEFNLMQDRRASQVIFDCGVPLVQIPCLGVASHLLTTVPELEQALKGRNAISDFLLKRFCDYHTDHFAWAKEIWDVSAIAWLINPEWVPTRLTPAPILTENLTWGTPPPDRHEMRLAWYVQRNPIFRDLFSKLQSYRP